MKREENNVIQQQNNLDSSSTDLKSNSDSSVDEQELRKILDVEILDI